MKGFGSSALATLFWVAFCGVAMFAYEIDDSVPEVTERVARISFIRGDVQVRRDGSQDWENAELNLPIVEGDEIAVEAEALLEIQFGKDHHLRVDERTLLNVTQMSESGIALSVSRGTISLRIRQIDTSREFFEIDGPGTTIAVQKAGSYRFDAGRDDQTEVYLAVTGGGEARVYSATSGFSVRSGRSAKVTIEGPGAGEWVSSDASIFNDDFARWADERDAVVEKALAASHYDKYYDRDIYGAEDLTSHGDWEYSGDYGYIWTPYRRSISSYQNWSPYRYGSWRWVPPFGWTWINAEPWGWATYHHGRWIWYRGRWVWTPYSHYRSNRSWWYPALVVVKIINRNICWYPLGYRNRYNNYNAYHDWLGNRAWRRRGRHDERRRDPRVNDPAQTPLPTSPDRRGDRPRRRDIEPDPSIPPGGVVMVPEEEFGKGRRVAAKAPPEIITAIRQRAGRTDGGSETLPTYESVRNSRRILEARRNLPEVVMRSNAAVRTGASDRVPDVPLDRDLRRSRIFGDRRPLTRIEDRNPNPAGENPSRRPVGAVTRDRRQSVPQGGTPNNEIPGRGVTPRGQESPPFVPPIRREPPRPRTRSTEETPPEDGTLGRPKYESPPFVPPIRRESPEQRGERQKRDPEADQRVKRPENQSPPYVPPIRRESPVPRRERPKRDPEADQRVKRPDNQSPPFVPPVRRELPRPDADRRKRDPSPRSQDPSPADAPSRRESPRRDVPRPKADIPVRREIPEQPRSVIRVPQRDRPSPRIPRRPTRRPDPTS